MTERTLAPSVDGLPLTARDLVFAAGGRRLVDIPDLSIHAGRPTVVMGPNGAGKSILLRLLHGLVAPTAGRVTLAGAPISAADRMRQAMVFQRPVLLRRSVAANVAFALKTHGVRRADRRDRVRDVLAEARLDHLSDQPARTLSGGEQQRLALARALACRPEILFLDEPTASLDPKSIHAIEALLAAASAGGTKLVLVTHDIGQARRIADDVLFMADGRIVERAKADIFFDAPQSAPARAFLAGRLLI